MNFETLYFTLIEAFEEEHMHQMVPRFQQHITLF